MRKNPSGLTLVMISDTEEWERDIKGAPITLSLDQMEDDGFDSFIIKDSEGKALVAFTLGEWG